MWQAPNQRVRALANQKKRERERQGRPLHIKRVNAEMKVIGKLAAQPQVAQGRLLLNDLSPKGLGLFCDQALMVGQEVALTIDEPKRFYVRGRVVWCQEHDAESHIMSSKPYSYRIGLQFLFQSAAEEEQVKAYCDELARDVLYSNGRQAA